MLDKLGSKEDSSKRFWSPRDSLETRLRRSYGETYHSIGAAIGFSADTVRIRAKQDKLKPAETVAERLALALALVADAVAHETLTGQAAGAEQHKQRQQLRMLYQALVPMKGRPAASQDKEADMKHLKDIKEMSDDDLRAYVASLVSGLEAKTTPTSEPSTDGIHGRKSVSEKRASGSDSATDGDGLA